MLIDDAIGVAAMLRLIVFGQGDEAIGLGRRRLRREAAKQFATIVNAAIAVAVEGEEGVVRACGSPGHALGDADALEVEADAAADVGQIKAVAERIDQDGAAFAVAEGAVPVAAVLRAATALRRAIS